jgi:hypothetical protein
MIPLTNSRLPADFYNSTGVQSSSKSSNSSVQREDDFRVSLGNLNFNLGVIDGVQQDQSEEEEDSRTFFAMQEDGLYS